MGLKVPQNDVVSFVRPESGFIMAGGSSSSFPGRPLGGSGDSRAAIGTDSLAVWSAQAARNPGTAEAVAEHQALAEAARQPPPGDRCFFSTRSGSRQDSAPVPLDSINFQSFD